MKNPAYFFSHLAPDVNKNIEAMSLDKKVLRTVATEGKENIVPYVSTYNHRDPEIFSVINENMPSNKKGNDQEVIQSHPTSLSRPKGKEGHTHKI